MLRKWHSLNKRYFLSNAMLLCVPSFQRKNEEKEAGGLWGVQEQTQLPPIDLPRWIPIGHADHRHNKELSS
jgi:hypothetical protein